MVSRYSIFSASELSSSITLIEAPTNKVTHFPVPTPPSQQRLHLGPRCRISCWSFFFWPPRSWPPSCSALCTKGCWEISLPHRQSGCFTAQPLSLDTCSSDYYALLSASGAAYADLLYAREKTCCVCVCVEK